MYSHTPKPPVFIVAAILAVLALALSACSFSPVGLSANLPDIEVTIPQTRLDLLSFNDGIQSSDPCDNLLDEVTRVELRDGFIRVQGTKAQLDRTLAGGSIDLRLGAENDALKVQIVAVDIPGIDLSHPCIVMANHELEEELGQLAIDMPGQVLFKEVSVEDGQLKLKIKVNLDGLFEPSISIHTD